MKEKDYLILKIALINAIEDMNGVPNQLEGRILSYVAEAEYLVSHGDQLEVRANEHIFDKAVSGM